MIENRITTLVLGEFLSNKLKKDSQQQTERISTSVWGSDVTLLTYSAGVSVSSWAAFASMVWGLIRKKDGHVVDERYSV